MHEIIKKTLQPLLNQAVSLTDCSPLMQKLIREISLKWKLSIVKRLNHVPLQPVQSQCRGILYELNLQDLLQREIFYNCYDSSRLSKFLMHIQPGGIYADIGANVGFYSLHMAKKLNKNGSVYAFEANPFIFEKLVKNCQINEFGTIITPHLLAVAQNCGRMTFYVSNGLSSGGSSLTFANTSKPIEIESISLDMFMNQNRIEYFDLIKIDVEGHEFELLEGSKKALSEKRIKKIYIEFNGVLLAEKNKYFNDFLNFFLSYGYKPSSGYLNMINKIKLGKINPNNIVEDFLFVLN